MIFHHISPSPVVGFLCNATKENVVEIFTSPADEIYVVE